MANIKLGGTTALSESGGTVTLDSAVQDNITRLGTVTTGTFEGTLNTSTTFPAGHVTNVHRYSVASSNEYGVTGTTPKISHNPVSFSGINGRHYSVVSTISCWPYKDTSDINYNTMELKLYWGVTSGRTQGGGTLDSLLGVHRVGSYFSANTTSGLNQYCGVTVIGSFTATSTAPHYVYFAQNGLQSTGISRTLANATSAWNTIIFEVMP